MIRRILLLILIPVLAISAISCDDIEDNTPALQVMVNGELFKAKEMQVATEENDGYTLTGINGNSALNIYLTDVTEGSYVLGGESRNTLSLSTEDGEFTTINENGGGEILITDSGMLDYITGTFHFLATDTSGTKMRGLNGHIYQVSFGSENMELPDGELENQATLVVSGESVSVTDINARLVEGEIEIVIIGENSQRISIVLPEMTEVGDINLPDADISFSYILDGDTFEVESGELEILTHDTDLETITANFEVITEGEHEITGSLQVAY